MEPIKLYNSGYLGIFNGAIDWVDNNIVAVLLQGPPGADNIYTPNVEHNTYNQIAPHIVTSSDYTPVALDFKQISHHDPNTDDEIRYTSNPVVWGEVGNDYKVTITARFLVLVVSSNGGNEAPSSGDPLLGWVDFGENGAMSNNADFAYTPSETGWFRIKKAL